MIDGWTREQLARLYFWATCTMCPRDAVPMCLLGDAGAYVMLRLDITRDGKLTMDDIVEDYLDWAGDRQDSLGELAESCLTEILEAAGVAYEERAEDRTGHWRIAFRGR